MARVVELAVIFLCVGAVVFAASVGLKTGSQTSFLDSVGRSQGTVIAFDAGLLIVEFSDPVVNSCGDTQIYGFVNKDDFSLQLKPVFIPDAKAGKVNERILVFPMWDIMAFMTEGVYTLEFYVDNNCSLFHNKTITLPPVPLVLGGGE